MGKSTLVRIFAQEEKLDLIELNLEINKIKSIHQDHFLIQNFLDELQILARKKITEKTLIFIDEIQEDPKMIQMLRYLYELAPQIAVIAAGSLLELTIKEGEYSFPVGRIEFYHLGPMSFSEFLATMEEGEMLLSKIKRLEFDDFVHERAIHFLKIYFYVGGMPKAVLEYSESRSIVDIRSIQSQILQTYIADFPKYKKRFDVQRIERVFKTCSYHLGKKVIYQNLDPQSKSRDIKKALELLIDAKVILPTYHCNAAQLPLESGLDQNIFKLYYLDIGLFNCLNDLDSKILFENFESAQLMKGLLAEQFVAQHLNYFKEANRLPALYYWLRDKVKEKGEIDFLVQQNNKIIPIEVKAEKGGKLKSLFYFSLEKKWAKAIKLSLAPLARQKNQHKININGKIFLSQIDYFEVPLYAVEFLPQIIEQFDQNETDPI